MRSEKVMIIHLIKAGCTERYNYLALDDKAC